MKRVNTILIAGMLTSSVYAQTPTSPFVTVVSKPVSRIADLPGEFLPFLSVSLHAKLPGFVERVLVDRGSVVKEGQLLVELSAPEMAARIAEAESKVQAAQSERLQAEAQLAGATGTYERLKKASATVGVIAGNELIQMEAQIAAAQALVQSRGQAVRAGEAAVQTQKQLQSYLRITAPFDGVVTDRLVHPGALVGAANDPVLLVIEQISLLRLVVAVPEEYVGGITSGSRASFKVPAFPERTYSGTVARISHVLDKGTRTMAVELDVANRDESLAPGMYGTVKWPVRSSHPALFVPRTSVVTTTEHTFVVRNSNGHAQLVDIRKGAVDGDLMEVMGDLKAGDTLVRRATDEIREGSPLAK
ncbi:MAG: efflux RND transporter periplasmic adaptor subunit [Acidobacteriota bacterium]